MFIKAMLIVLLILCLVPFASCTKNGESIYEGPPSTQTTPPATTPETPTTPTTPTIPIVISLGQWADKRDAQIENTTSGPYAEPLQADSDGFIVFASGGNNAFTTECYICTGSDKDTVKACYGKTGVSTVLRNRAMGYNGAASPVKKGDYYKLQVPQATNVDGKCSYYWIPSAVSFGPWADKKEAQIENTTSGPYAEPLQADSDGFIVFASGGNNVSTTECYICTGSDKESVKACYGPTGVSAIPVLRNRAMGYNGAMSPVKKGDYYKLQVPQATNVDGKCSYYWIPSETSFGPWADKKEAQIENTTSGPYAEPLQANADGFVVFFNGGNNASTTECYICTGSDKESVKACYGPTGVSAIPVLRNRAYAYNGAMSPVKKGDYYKLQVPQATNINGKCTYYWIPLASE